MAGDRWAVEAKWGWTKPPGFLLQCWREVVYSGGGINGVGCFVYFGLWEAMGQGVMGLAK